MSIAQYWKPSASSGRQLGFRRTCCGGAAAPIGTLPVRLALECQRSLAVTEGSPLSGTAPLVCGERQLGAAHICIGRSEHRVQMQQAAGLLAPLPVVSKRGSRRVGDSAFP